MRTISLDYNPYTNHYIFVDHPNLMNMKNRVESQNPKDIATKIESILQAYPGKKVQIKAKGRATEIVFAIHQKYFNRIILNEN